MTESRDRKALREVAAKLEAGLTQQAMVVIDHALAKPDQAAELADALSWALAYVPYRVDYKPQGPHDEQFARAKAALAAWEQS